MDSGSKIFLIVALFIIMIGMGLSLTTADFKRVLRFPKAVFIGFLNQIILLPLIAFGLTQFFDVSNEIAIGVMILSACPGGPTSNLVTHLAKGDTALSVTLTAVNSVVTIITIPIIVNFALGEFTSSGDEIVSPVKDIIGALLAIIAVPLTIGMIVKNKKPDVAARMDKPVRIASTLIIILVIVGIVIKERAQLVERVSESFAIVFTLNVATMLLGYITARFARLSFKQALAICLESGNQNGTLAIQISSLINIAYGFPAAVYSLFMYFTASIPIMIGLKKAKEEV
ncbi:MAG: bile acid:sodium symporter [Flavobacteriales bacterium]|nr:bile acid:sodium symporter [Flavobacteriales bacterium]|tara:strand:- start:14500 stop:15357 length:858 start_codon:yes stop_codon:yes gene_type:complete